jgi:hypothetical protein
LKGFGDSLSSPLLAREAIMAAKEISVKKYGNCPGWATAIRIGDRLFWTAEAVSDSRIG